jgi:hypothetical protein
MLQSFYKTSSNPNGPCFAATKLKICGIGNLLGFNRRGGGDPGKPQYQNADGFPEVDSANRCCNPGTMHIVYAKW